MIDPAKVTDPIDRIRVARDHMLRIGAAASVVSFSGMAVGCISVLMALSGHWDAFWWALSLAVALHQGAMYVWKRAIRHCQAVTDQVQFEMWADFPQSPERSTVDWV